ncbi:hypothetical protein LDENG_00015210 [Lucifuga dentata]|nr:hypothetical protein LDENG_00015210 [Lucifuga dentata]
MRTEALLALLCLHTLVSSHILGRPASTSDLAQLQSLLELFENSLPETTQEKITEDDYEGTNQEPEHGRAGRGWSVDQEADQEALIPERSQLPAEGHSWTPSQRNHLQDLLMAAKKRVSGCFGARMDRIGNASGLGCNNGRG